MDDFDTLLAEQLRDHEFRSEWEALQPELTAVQAEINAQKEAVQCRISSMMEGRGSNSPALL